MATSEGAVSGRDVPLATQPRFVVTLVHGTWAPDADWTREKSPLRKLLQEQFGDDVHVNPFTWSGANDYGGRLAAGKELRQCLGELTNTYTTAKHVIVAHSHGGNVALYALNDEKTASKISGLVTLATPFLVCKPKRFALSLGILIYSAVFGSALLFLSSVVVPLVLRGLDYAHTLNGWREIAVYIGVLWLGYAAGDIARGVGTFLAGNLMDLALERAGQRQAELTSTLTTPQAAKVPLFAIRFRGDEARLLLWFSSASTMLLPLVFKAVGYVFFVAYAFAWLVIFVDIVFTFMEAVFGVWLPLAPLTQSQELYWASFGLVLLALVSVLGFTKVIRGHRWAFGAERLVTPLVARIVVADLPAAATNAAMTYYGVWPAFRDMIAKRGLHRVVMRPHLLHSWLYEYEPAIREICNWMVACPISESSISDSGLTTVS